MKKRVLAIILCISLVFASVMPFSAFAEDISLNLPTTNVAPVVKSYNNLNDLQKKIYDGLKNFDEKIYIGIFAGVNLDYATQLYTSVVDFFPEFYYVSSSFESTSSGSKITNIYPCYAMTRSEYNASKAVFTQGVKDALSTLDSSMNDVQKALVLHDYILSHSVYADDEKDIAHSAWGFFYNGRVVCAGLALVYSYLLKQAGIQAEYVFSNKMHHAWNAVMIDGEWYYVDLTYDGQTINASFPDPDYISFHRWFLKSESYMSGNSGLGHQEFMSRDYPNDGTDNKRGSGNKYDSYFWDDIGTNILVYNGYYYYLKPNYTGGYSKLVKRDKNGNESNVTSGSFYSSMGSISMADISGFGYSQTVHYSFGMLTQLEGKLIISISNAIQAMPLNGSGYPQTIDYTNNRSNASTYQLYIKDNKVCYKIIGSTTERSFNKMNYFKNYISTRSNGYNMFYYCDVDNNNVINAQDYLIIKKQMAR